MTPVTPVYREYSTLDQYNANNDLATVNEWLTYNLILFYCCKCAG